MTHTNFADRVVGFFRDNFDRGGGFNPFVSHLHGNNNDSESDIAAAGTTENDTNQSTENSPRRSRQTSNSTALTIAEQSDPDLRRAAQYVSRVKKIFPHGSVTYKNFMALLIGCKAGRIAVKDGFEQVSILFRDDLDLLEGFIYFLPSKVQVYAKEQLTKIATESSYAKLIKQPDFGTCILCMDRPRSHSFVPCGHLCACGFCASLALTRSGSCPVCSVKTSRVMRVYLP